MEAPTLKEVVDQLVWKAPYDNSATKRHRLVARYEWESETWQVVMEPWINGKYIGWSLELRSSIPFAGDCESIEDAVSACGDAILKQINFHMATKLREEEENRKLREHNAKAQKWADRANSVTVEE